MASHKSLSSAQEPLDKCTGDATNGIGGLVFAAVDRAGTILTANASGTKGLNNKKPMDLDTVFWIASCTKLLCAIGCMQLVEQGKLALDDPKHLYELCPELAKVQVLQKDGSLRPKTRDITLRQLLTHTSGFAYEFFHEGLRDHGRPVGYDVFQGDVWDIYRQPLVHEPGTDWEYGIGIDWAGIALERATGVKLNDWIQQHIMQPLGLENINMFPSQHMRDNLADMHQRWHTGKVEERDHILRRPLMAESAQDKDRIFNSGGAGAFAKPIEYIQVLAALLNDGTSPKTGQSILKPETVKLMFENQIPDFPQFGRKGIPAAKSEQTNAVPDIYPQPGNPAQGWGISFMTTIEPGLTGRGANTAWWAGIANCFWWCDREKGVAGMIACQVMPFADPNVLGTWVACEKAVYDSL